MTFDKPTILTNHMIAKKYDYDDDDDDDKAPHQDQSQHCRRFVASCSLDDLLIQISASLSCDQHHDDHDAVDNHDDDD